ncbi:flagellin [Aliikangiella coralliicola]|uniref:Flagellin n=1 Tax=Aliikangiella coralliicola TaxID=2592383 RepID=A0A545U5U8_9GAMM|nr:flagellin [Aliikangiella coralliicola]TQV84848.1 flagellin [Aliikangiella coralliicola]
MGNVLSTNVSSLNAQRNLINVNGSLAQTFKRLSSGLRINSAKDDAAGLQISNGLTSQINGLSVASRNANDGISLAQVAEGAMQETTNILQRIRDLAIQSANGSNGPSERAALNAEVQQLIQEVDRIANTTRFGSRNILTGTLTGAQFQVGAQAFETINISINSARADDLGINDLDFAGFASNRVAATSTTPASAMVADNLTFTVNSATSTVAVSAGDSAQQIADKINSEVPNVTADAKTTARLAFAGTLDGDESFSVSINGNTSIVVTGATEDDLLTSLGSGIQQLGALSNLEVNVDLTNNYVEITDQTGADVTVQLTAYTGGDADEDLTVDFVDTGGTPGGTPVVLDAVSEGTVVTGDIAFTTSDTNSTFSLIGSTATGAGGVIGVASVAGNVTSGTRVSALDISTNTGAQAAIAVVDASIKQIDSNRADLGAVQNRLSSTISNLQSIIENVAAARSRIRDTDYATETSELSKNQVLQQAGLSVLAQANASSQSVLSLLQG